MKTSKAQLKASYKWKRENSAKQRNYQYGSYARKFIRDIANEKQLKQLKNLIDQRLSQIK